MRATRTRGDGRGPGHVGARPRAQPAPPTSGPSRPTPSSALGALAVLSVLAALALLGHPRSGPTRGAARRHGRPRPVQVGRAPVGTPLVPVADDHPGRRHRSAGGCWWPWSQFAKGGYLLAYLPAATIALLLPLGALIHRTIGRAGPHRVAGWPHSVSPSCVAHSGPSGSSSGDGVLPQRSAPGLDRGACGSSSRATRRRTPTPARPSAPPTPSTRRCAACDPRSVRTAMWWCSTPSTVAATSTGTPGGQLPDDRIALIVPGQVLYNQLQGALYYTSGQHRRGRAVGLGLSGGLSRRCPDWPPSPPRATRCRWPLPSRSADYRVWQILPGASILGVPSWSPARSPPARDVGSDHRPDLTARPPSRRNGRSDRPPGATGTTGRRRPDRAHRADSGAASVASQIRSTTASNSPNPAKLSPPPDRRQCSTVAAQSGVDQHRGAGTPRFGHDQRERLPGRRGHQGHGVLGAAPTSRCSDTGPDHVDGSGAPSGPRPPGRPGPGAGARGVAACRRRTGGPAARSPCAGRPGRGRPGRDRPRREVTSLAPAVSSGSSTPSPSSSWRWVATGNIRWTRSRSAAVWKTSPSAAAKTPGNTGGRSAGSSWAAGCRMVGVCTRPMTRTVG